MTLFPSFSCTVDARESVAQHIPEHLTPALRAHWEMISTLPESERANHMCGQQNHGRGCVSRDIGPAPGLKGFSWSNEQECHIVRRREMLQKYPQIKRLFGFDYTTTAMTVLYVMLQLTLSVWSQKMSLAPYLLTAYVGGWFTHALTLSIHEITHNLAAHSPDINRLVAYVANIPMVVPYAMVFRGYHAEHHRYLGWDHIDTDLPSDIELRLLQSAPGKLFFLTFQILFYALRPCIIRPTAITKDVAENWMFTMSFNVLWFALWGWGPMVYLSVSTVLGGSIGPFTGHFISEHYTFDEDGAQETYSYYGVWNWFNFCVGYHNEHHDFPNIPAFRLHKLHEIAPEYYSHLKVTPSWWAVTWRFLTDSRVGVWARVKRERYAHKRSGGLFPTTHDIRSHRMASEDEMVGDIALPKETTPCVTHG